MSRHIGGKDVVLSYVPAGNYVGEMALLAQCAALARPSSAAIATETIRLDGAVFQQLLEHNPALRAQDRAAASLDRLAQEARRRSRPAWAASSSFLIAAGRRRSDRHPADRRVAVRPLRQLREGLRRDPRRHLAPRREAGPTFANVHVPTSCRHCEHPHCMKDCPPDAIHRAPNGEVFIDDNCIGCGNCERNCPYGVIQMARPPPQKPGLLQWLLFGAGPGPAASGATTRRRTTKAKALGAEDGRQVRHVQGHRRRRRPACAPARPAPRSASARHSSWAP